MFMKTKKIIYFLYDIEYFFLVSLLMAQEFNTLSLMIHSATFVSLIVLLRANWRGGTTKKYIH